MKRVLDLFSCIGCHASGFARAGAFETVAFVEASAFRRSILAAEHPGVSIYDDVRTFKAAPGSTDIVIGGPPCQRTSVASAIHGYRNGESLWPDMLRIALESGAEWIVVEQPPGNKAWEAQVHRDLSNAGRHVARFEFGACDLGAPYIRRRVYLVACSSLSRLEIAGEALASSIARVARAANARGTWDTGILTSLPVAAGAAGESGAARKEWIEALGDSNPPEMAEVIAHCILAAEAPPTQEEGR